MTSPHHNHAIREQFPVLSQRVNNRRLAWLDSASTALKPECVIDAVSEVYRDYPANIHRSVHTLGEAATLRFEQARATAQRFLNAADPAEIVFTSGTTDSINLVANTCSPGWLSSGDEVLVSEMEHHANIVPWQMLRDRAGIKLRVLPMTPEGDITPDVLRANITSRTRLVALTALSNAIGTVPPLDVLIPIVHDAGARVLVDAAQAAACMPVDVQALDCDYLACSGHKLFGPTGVGVLYAKRSWLESMPPFRGGGDMIRSVTFEKTLYNALPYKFEAGTAPIAQAIGMARALEWIDEIGFDRIQEHEQRLVNLALEALESIPEISIVGRPSQRAAIVSFLIDGVHPHDAGTLLDEDGVAVRAGHHCAQPLMQHFGVPATLRCSFSIYNNDDDIEQMIQSLHRIIRMFS